MQHATMMAIKKMEDTYSDFQNNWNNFIKSKRLGEIDFPKIVFDHNIQDNTMFSFPDATASEKQLVNEFFDKNYVIDIFRSMFKGHPLFNKFATFIYDKSMMEKLPLNEKKFCAAMYDKAYQYANNALIIASEFLNMSRMGIHEICISDHQALGMAHMKFDIPVENLVMPVDSIFVHIPKTVFKLSIFKENLPLLIENCRSNSTPEDVATQRFINTIEKNGENIVVLIQKHGGPNHTVSAKFYCGPLTAVTFASVHGNFEEVLQDDRVGLLTAQYAIRAALSACMIAAMKPNLYSTRSMDKSIQKDRSFFLDKLNKVIPIKKELCTYNIFQNDMKTYHDRTGTGAGVSPESVTIKPIFVHGHWRLQPYGEKRSLRRVQWIKAHIRNKDLLLTNDPKIITSSKFTQPDEIIKAEVNCSHNG